jgi:hypothetical protein
LSAASASHLFPSLALCAAARLCQARYGPKRLAREKALLVL